MFEYYLDKEKSCSMLRARFCFSGDSDASCFYHLPWKNLPVIKQRINLYTSEEMEDYLRENEGLFRTGRNTFKDENSDRTVVIRPFLSGLILPKVFDLGFALSGAMPGYVEADRIINLANLNRFILEGEKLTGR